MSALVPLPERGSLAYQELVIKWLDELLGAVGPPPAEPFRTARRRSPRQSARK